MCPLPTKREHVFLAGALLFAILYSTAVEAMAGWSAEVDTLKTACNDNDGLKEIYRDWKNKGRPIVAECYDGTKWRIFNGKVVPYAKQEKTP
jgi:hypothetical protein